MGRSAKRGKPSWEAVVSGGRGLEKDGAGGKWADWDSAVEMVRHNRTC